MTGKRTPPPGVTLDANGGWLSAPEAVVSRIIEAVTSRRWRWKDEAELQRLLAAAFVEDEIKLAREYTLTATERPDFFHLAAGVAVEVKVKGAAASVMRQLWRYASRPEVAVVILITSVARHAASMPATLYDKPLHVVQVKGFL